MRDGRVSTFMLFREILLGLILPQFLDIWGLNSLDKTSTPDSSRTERLTVVIDYRDAVKELASQIRGALKRRINIGEHVLETKFLLNTTFMFFRLSNSLTGTKLTADVFSWCHQWRARLPGSISLGASFCDGISDRPWRKATTRARYASFDFLLVQL